MISTFFNRTKPINILVLLGANLLLFWLVMGWISKWKFDNELFLVQCLSSIALLVSVFFIGNMVKSKKLSADNSYSMLYFSLLLLVFFEVIRSSSLVFSNFFLLLSMDRALALKSEKNQKEKIFESALWVFVASLFVDWAIVFIVPLYISIGIFCSKQIRIWAMPLAALCCVFILSLSVIHLFGGIDFFAEHYRFRLTLNFFFQPNYYLMGYVILIFIIVFWVFGKLGYRRMGRTLSIRLVFAYLIVGVLAMLISNNQEGMVLFTFFPASIFLTNYIETIKKTRLKETFVIASILLPVLGFFLRLFQ